MCLGSGPLDGAPPPRRGSPRAWLRARVRRGLPGSTRRTVQGRAALEALRRRARERHLIPREPLAPDRLPDARRPRVGEHGLQLHRKRLGRNGVVAGREIRELRHELRCGLGLLGRPAGRDYERKQRGVRRARVVSSPRPASGVSLASAARRHSAHSTGRRVERRQRHERPAGAGLARPQAGAARRVGKATSGLEPLYAANRQIAGGLRALVGAWYARMPRVQGPGARSNARGRRVLSARLPGRVEPSPRRARALDGSLGPSRRPWLHCATPESRRRRLSQTWPSRMGQSFSSADALTL